jgi:hypothetical protein
MKAARLESDWNSRTSAAARRCALIGQSRSQRRSAGSARTLLTVAPSFGSKMRSRSAGETTVCPSNLLTMPRSFPGRPFDRAKISPMTAGESEGMARRSSSVAACSSSGGMAKTSSCVAIGASRALVAASTSLAPCLRASVIFASVPGSSLSESSTSTTISRSSSPPASSTSRASARLAVNAGSIHATARPATPSDHATRQSSAVLPGTEGTSNATTRLLREAPRCAPEARWPPLRSHDGPRRVHLANDLAGPSWVTRRSSIATRLRSETRGGIFGGRAADDLLQRGLVLGREAVPRMLEELAQRRASAKISARTLSFGTGHELGCGIARREAFGLRPPLLPRGGEPQIDERPPPVFADDDVGRLDVAVQKRRAMKRRQLVGRERECSETARRIGAVLDQLEQALSFHQLAHQEGPPALGQPPKAKHPRYAEPFQPGERHGFAHQGLHFALRRPRSERLQGKGAPAQPIADGPYLTATSLAERGDRFVPRRKLGSRHDETTRAIRSSWPGRRTGR